MAVAFAVILSGALPSCAIGGALAKKQSNAAAVVTLYKLFLQDATIDKAEKEIAEEQLAHWEDLKSAGAVRVGSKWLTAAELQTMRGEEERLVVEASKRAETETATGEGVRRGEQGAVPSASLPHFFLGSTTRW